MIIFEKAVSIMKSTPEATLALLDENGCPTASTISSIRTDGMFTVWFCTGLDTPKAKRIARSGKAGVCYRNGGSNVSLTGTIAIVTDAAIKRELWQDWFIDHFPDGSADPNYCVLQFTAQRVSLWIDNEQVEVSFAQGEAQSRCGLLCDSCSFKETNGCEGCVNIKNPFWGECPVKACCESKKLSHCGECPEIPCAILSEFSCGEGEHCDSPKGLRIAQCGAWKQ